MGLALKPERPKKEALLSASRPHGIAKEVNVSIRSPLLRRSLSRVPTQIVLETRVRSGVYSEAIPKDLHDFLVLEVDDILARSDSLQRRRPTGPPDKYGISGTEAGFKLRSRSGSE